ncbi:MAG: sporulation membrane protein YtaF [Bacillota bacterium]
MDPVSLGLLALALSLDSLMVGLLYGLRGIRLSWAAISIVATATGLLLMLSMAAGGAMAAVLPPAAAGRAGAVLLAAVGLWITYQTLRSQREAGTAAPRPAPAPLQKVWRLQLGSVGIVIQILREPGAADLDRSGHINPLEAVLLGVALALDSTAAGLGAAMAGFSTLGLPLAAGCATLSLLYAGSRWARVLPIRLEGPWAAIHGVVLLGVGLYRMIA